MATAALSSPFTSPCTKAKLEVYRTKHECIEILILVMEEEFVGFSTEQKMDYLEADRKYRAAIDKKNMVCHTNDKPVDLLKELKEARL